MPVGLANRVASVNQAARAALASRAVPVESARRALPESEAAPVTPEVPAEQRPRRAQPAGPLRTASVTALPPRALPPLGGEDSAAGAQTSPVPVAPEVGLAWAAADIAVAEGAMAEVVAVAVAHAPADVAVAAEVDAGKST